MNKFFALVLMVGLAIMAVPNTASADHWRNFNEYDLSKRLPDGFHDFWRLPRAYRIWYDSEGVVCDTWRQAISYGKRIALGYDVDEAAVYMKQAWGSTVCGYLRPRRDILPIEYAVRGDDQGRPIAIIKWKDESGNIFFTGWPSW